MDHLSNLDVSTIESHESKLNSDGEFDLDLDGKTFKLTKAMIPEVKRYEKKVHVQEIIPSVIEPSFGIGRIMYAVLEHNFKVRPNDEARRSVKTF